MRNTSFWNACGHVFHEVWKAPSCKAFAPQPCFVVDTVVCDACVMQIARDRDFQETHSGRCCRRSGNHWISSHPVLSLCAKNALRTCRLYMYNIPGHRVVCNRGMYQLHSAIHIIVVTRLSRGTIIIYSDNRSFYSETR